MPDLLDEALALHLAGKWVDAARLYQAILEHTPNDPDALHLFGALHGQQGQHARAVELLSQAISLRPHDAAFHADLAEACRGLGDLERAVECCRAALALRPDYPEALNNLGLALHGLGRREEAVGHFQSALRLRPDFAVAHYNLGLVMHELRQFDEALLHFGHAVDLAPDFAMARGRLARVFLERGQPAEALPHCLGAARLEPHSAVWQHELGKALRDLKRPTEAQAAYREALRLAPDFARVHADLGHLLKQQGRLHEALPWLEKAADLEPLNPNWCAMLGEVHGEIGDSEAAVACWQRAVALDPDQAKARLGLGWSLRRQGRAREASEHYQIALRLEPEMADVHMAIGGLHEEVGELAEAEAAYRAALRVQPSYPLSLSRLAKLLRGKLPQADRVALEERLADQHLNPEYRAALLFGLAQVFDASGEYARAAETARQANAATLEWVRGWRDYDPAQHKHFVDGVLRVFDRDFFARVAGGGLPTRRPVFIFGLPRSGTTLVEQVLASHPQVYGAGELTLGRETFVRIPAALGRADTELNCVPHLDGGVVHRLAQHHLDQLDAVDGGRADRIVDKMPTNYMMVGLLMALFPQATFIHCRRDLRDVAVSCWLTDFDAIRWANRREDIASVFQQYVRLMEHWKGALPAPMHDVTYEAMVADLEGSARRLIGACGLDWHPACLDFHRTRRVVRTSSVVQVREPIHAKSVGRWKHYEGLLNDLFAALPGASERAPA